MRQLIVVALLVLSCTTSALAQTPVATVNLGKPTPNAGGRIYANVNTQLVALPASAPSCTAALDTLPAGDALVGVGYNASFTASSQHSQTGQGGAPLVTGYVLRVYAPTASQPCYTADVVAVNADGSSDPATKGPFPLALGRPAALQGNVGILKP
jgi:hypothetical protein